MSEEMSAKEASQHIQSAIVAYVDKQPGDAVRHLYSVIGVGEGSVERAYGVFCALAGAVCSTTPELDGGDNYIQFENARTGEVIENPDAEMTDEQGQAAKWAARFVTAYANGDRDMAPVIFEELSRDEMVAGSALITLLGMAASSWEQYVKAPAS